MRLGGMEHLAQESRTLGVSTELPDLFLALARRAADGGHAGDGYAAMIEQFRRPSA
ncbi:hypothetical protein [Nonomuraea sp. NPDC049646]|uniref:imine reductase family protein n=1 Tax=unclassified Nonomuraea TaxID=2593643 RepID=UPI0037996DA5